MRSRCADLVRSLPHAVRWGVTATCLSLLTVSCSKAPEEQVPVNPAEEERKPQQSVPEWPSASRYLNRIEDSGTPTKTPFPPPIFEWNFSRAVTFKYRYEHTIDRQAYFVSKEPYEMLETAVMMGSLEVETRDKNSAAIFIREAQCRMARRKKPEDQPFEQVGDASRLAVSELGKRGEHIMDFPYDDPYTWLLMPLPEKGSIADDGTFERSVKIPIDVGGVRAMGSGTLRTVLTGYVTLEDQTCARFESVLEVKDPAAVTEQNHVLELNVHGKAVSYFNVETRAFQRADAALLVTAEGDTGIGLQKTRRVYIMADHHIRLRLSERARQQR